MYECEEIWRPFRKVEECDVARHPSNISRVDNRRRPTSPNRHVDPKEVPEAPIIGSVLSNENELSEYSPSTPKNTPLTPLKESTALLYVLMSPLAAPLLDYSEISW